MKALEALPGLVAFPNSVKEISEILILANKNKLDNEVQDTSLKKMVSNGLLVNEVNDIKEFQTVLESFKTNYVKDKYVAWKDFSDKISKVK